MKVLITGGSGFIGTSIVENLIKDGLTVMNIDKTAPLKQDQAKWWQHVDILDYTAFEIAAVNFDPGIIIHLAAITDLEGRDLSYYAANIEGTQNLIQIASKLPSLTKIIFSSSMYVCTPGLIPADYNTYTPHTIYGESKMKGELLVKNIVNPAYDWVIIRPTSIWGPWFKKPYIDFFTIVYKRQYFDFGKACTKTYGYIDNTVYQIRKLLDAQNVHGKTFYLGDLPPTQISEWANEISIEMNKGEIKKIPYFLLKAGALAGDILARIKISFPLNSFRLFNMTTNNILPLKDIYEIAGEPPFTRKEGIKKTLQWLKEHKGYKI